MCVNVWIAKLKFQVLKCPVLFPFIDVYFPSRTTVEKQHTNSVDLQKQHIKLSVQSLLQKMLGFSFLLCWIFHMLERRQKQGSCEVISGSISMSAISAISSTVCFSIQEVFIRVCLVFAAPKNKPTKKKILSNVPLLNPLTQPALTPLSSKLQWEVEILSWILQH